jgi:hypothetical protein
MKQKPKPQRTAKAATPATVIARAIRAARRRMKNPDNGVRYVVYERPFRSIDSRFFLDVGQDAFRFGACTAGTLFKQERIARLVAREYSVRQQRRLHVMKVTIKVSGRRDGAKR